MTVPAEAMAQMFEAHPANNLPQGPNYNICPTTQVAVVTSADGLRHLRPMRWGFVPHWFKKLNGGPLLINARAETIAEKPAFRDAVRARRCLLLASGFYEWQRLEDGRKLPWYVQRSDGAPMAFAAIWQDWGDAPSCAIVTTSANRAMAAIHHRIPVILERADWSLWLGEDGKGAASLLQAPGEDCLRFGRVSPAVNSSRATGPELIEPCEDL